MDHKITVVENNPDMVVADDRLEYIMLISIPFIVISIFLSISVIYFDFSVALFSSLFLATWIAVVMIYIRPRMYRKYSN